MHHAQRKEALETGATKMAQFIYHHYVAREGPMVVSLPSDLRDEITEAITGYGALSAAGTSISGWSFVSQSSMNDGGGGSSCTLSAKAGDGAKFPRQCAWADTNACTKSASSVHDAGNVFVPLPSTP